MVLSSSPILPDAARLPSSFSGVPKGRPRQPDYNRPETLRLSDREGLRLVVSLAL
jgi:hypothetical protein